MTISSVTSKVVYVGNETTKVFPYPFKINDEEDLDVIRYYVATGSSDTLALNTDYVVSGVGSDSGGNVTLTGSVAAVSAGTIYVHTGNQLVIRRYVSLTQETDYVANDPFPAETHEAALDRLCMADQQLQEQIDRSIKADINQTTSSTTFTEVYNQAVAAAASSSAVAVSSATVAVNAISSSNTSAVNAAASAVLASLSAASVSSGVTRALDNLTPTAINESLLPAVTDTVNLGSYGYLWSIGYMTLVSASFLDVSNTANIITLRSTLVTATSLRVSGTSNFVTLDSTLLSSATLNISGTANTVTLVATLLTATTSRVSGTTNAVTLAATLLTATTLNISGTANATNLSGDGSLLTGLTNIPSGLIAMWSGTIATIPTGWLLCNGSNGTPDLRDRFVVCASQDDAGIAVTNVTGSLTQSGNGSIPAHAHGVTYGAGGSSDYPDKAAGSNLVTVNTTSVGTGTKNIAVYYALAFIMKS